MPGNCPDRRTDRQTDRHVTLIYKIAKVSIVSSFKHSSRWQRHNNDDKGQGFYVTEHSGITCLLDWVSQWLSCHPKPHTELLQVSRQNSWRCHCVLDIFFQLLKLLYHWGKVSQTLIAIWCHPGTSFWRYLPLSGSQNDIQQNRTPYRQHLPSWHWELVCSQWSFNYYPLCKPTQHHPVSHLQSPKFFNPDSSCHEHNPPVPAHPSGSWIQLKNRQRMWVENPLTYRLCCWRMDHYSSMWNNSQSNAKSFSYEQHSSCCFSSCCCCLLPTSCCTSCRCDIERYKHTSILRYPYLWRQLIIIYEGSNSLLTCWICNCDKNSQCHCKQQQQFGNQQMLLKQTSNPKHSLSLTQNQPGVFFFFFMQFSQASCRTVLRLHVHLPSARKEEQSYNVRPVLKNGATEGQVQEQVVHFISGPPRAALLRRTTSLAIDNTSQLTRHTQEEGVHSRAMEETAPHLLLVVISCIIQWCALNRWCCWELLVIKWICASIALKSPSPPQMTTDSTSCVHPQDSTKS